MPRPSTDRIDRRRFVASLALFAAPPAVWSAQTPGPVLAVGGALRDDNETVWARLAALAGGAGAQVAVIATASGEPQRAAVRVDERLRRHGVRGLAIEAAPLLGGAAAARAAAHAPRWVDAVAASQGVFFTGGAQARLLDTLAPGGEATPLLQAVYALHARGGVVAGSSSGAAVLSTLCFREAPDLIGALRGTLRDGIEVDRGFGFLPPQLLVDQHFVQRGRIGRLLPLLASRRVPLGLGVEEDSAALLHAGTLEVLGRHGVLVADLAEAQVDGLAPLALRGARLHWLRPGDRLALASRQATPAASAGLRIDPLASGHRPADPGPAFYPAMLDEGVLVRALQRLVDGDRAELHGLSFLPPPGDGGPAFAWRLHRGPGTRGWIAEDGALAVADARLDVHPVRLAQPLATPWSG
jgi:cyanophycinase